MPEMSGVRRKQLHEEGQKVSLWSLIFEKQEREAREKEMKKRKGKRIKWGLLFLPLLCMAEPNGYFSWDRATDTFTMIADEAQVDTLQLDITYSDGSEEGRLQWNSDDGTLEYGLPGGNVNLQVGQEMVMKVTNKSGATISNGVPVYISGAQGSRPTIAKADADGTNAYHAVAVTTEDIANNGSGYVTAFGLVRGVDTSSWTAGDDLFLSTTAGEYTNSAPAYPAESVHLGTVLFSNAESGIILANPHPEITYADIDSIYSITDTNITASAGYVGKTRYYTTASNSYVDVCMQTGTNSYTWVNIQSYGW